MEREIARCIAEQDECGELLRSDCPDRRGAQLWASDLIKEEILLRRGCENDCSNSNTQAPAR